MFTLTDNETLASFEAGQKKLQQESAEHEARMVEEIENRIYHMGTPETAEQKLRRANSWTDNQWSKREIELTQQERRGLSVAEFNKLRPEVRLQLYNEALYHRERS